jgi:uroporphyrinogen III methyltransferase/synthase
VGKVFLVGAGPGDPELITWKGRLVLARADSILFDHLANEALLDLAPSAAERIYVGKKKSIHAFSQEEICRMLIERAQRGLTVVRLKGGDPFIFGRGGEEAEALANAGVPFEVVPGVTAPLGLAAYTGVPLTHRDHTSVVTFVTGHSVADIDWNKVGTAETLVIFMGLTTFGEIAREIVARGRSADTPAMAVRWATRPDQETVVATLGTLAERIKQRGLKPPATIVVGEVVRLREKLDWFSRLPLAGQRIIVTRAQDRAGYLAARLRSLGADAIELPAIEILPAEDYSGLDSGVANLSSYDWLIFTSANGVRFFLDRLDRSRQDIRALRGKVAAIGPATRSALEQLHLKVDLMGGEFVAEGLLEALRGENLSSARILLPRAAVARDTLPQGLRARGAHVDVVAAYRTAAPGNLAARARDLLAGPRRPDWITFTSSSTVQNLTAAAGVEALAGIRVASIGPVTSSSARNLGIAVEAEAAQFDEDGLIEAILAKKQDRRLR